MSQISLLSVLLLLPLAGGVCCALLPAGAARGGSLATALATLFATVAGVALFDPRKAGLQFVERHAWIPGLGVEYHVGIDGISIGFVIVTALLTLFALWASPRAMARDRAFVALVLTLEAMLLGTFVAQNFFLWFLCYELTLIPAYLLIRLWGGSGRDRASLQFILTTQAGGIALLIGFLAMARATGTFDLPSLANLGGSGELARRLAAEFGFPQAAALVCGLVLFGLAVKVPLMPLHTWLPPAYAEAPTPVTMLLTGALSKLGLYGMLRLLLPLFPAELAQFRTALIGLAALTVLASALAALAQRDLKRILAYSSINHLGLCMLAIFATANAGSVAERHAALLGALVLGVNHGLTAPTLFWFAGLLEARAGGRRGLADFGGIRAAAPVFAGMMGVALFASIGLPGLNGFPGELLIFRGVMPLASWAAFAGLFGLLMTAVFLLRILHQVFHGPLPAGLTGFADLTAGERWVAAGAVGLILLLGLWPRLLVDLMESTVGRLAG